MVKEKIKIPKLHDNQLPFMNALEGLANVKTRPHYTIAETFAGAGGSHIGFKNQGFKSLYINEWDKYCLKTLQYNNPEIINL